MRRFSNDLSIMSVLTEILISVLTETLMSVLYFESLPSQSFFHQVSPPVDHFCFPRLFCFFFLILLSKIKRYRQKQNREALRKSGHSSQRIYSYKQNIKLFVKYQCWKINLITYLNITNCFVQKKVVFCEDNSSTYLRYSVLPCVSNKYRYRYSRNNKFENIR